MFRVAVEAYLSFLVEEEVLSFQGEVEEVVDPSYLAEVEEEEDPSFQAEEEVVVGQQVTEEVDDLQLMVLRVVYYYLS